MGLNINLKGIQGFRGTKVKHSSLWVMSKPMRSILLGFIDSISMEVIEYVVVSIKHLGVVDCNIQCCRLTLSVVSLDWFAGPNLLSTLALVGTPAQPCSLSRS